MRRPLLLDTDRLRLNTDFTVANTTLSDKGIGVDHSLRPKGVDFCRFVQKWRIMADVQAFCAQHGISAHEMNDSLTFLHSIGGLEHQRASFWRSQLVGIQHQVYGVRFAAPVWREPANVATIFHGVFRACRTVLVALFCLLLIFGAAGTLALPSLSIIFVYTGLLLVGSVYIHELVHFLWLPDHQHVRFIQQGMRCGLAHRPTHDNRALFGALSGPVAGSLTCCLVALMVGAVASHSFMPLIAMCLCLIHLSALLPWYGDGRSLLSLRKSQTEATS